MDDENQVLAVHPALPASLYPDPFRIPGRNCSRNRIAALGMNVVLLDNLAGSAILYARFFRGRVGLSRLWDWQMSYLYVIAGWAAVVALLFPLLFGFE